jgi:hypothetical protein
MPAGVGVRRLVAVLALGALAACGSKDAKKPQGTSFERVLPGSASDAMLPYDTATSSPPLAPPTFDPPDTATGKSQSTSAPDDAADIAPEAEAT